MKVGETPGEAAVHFLWEWIPLVICSKAGFYMEKLCFCIKRGEACHKCRCGIPLGDNEIWLLGFQHRHQGSEGARREIGQRLTIRHQLQVVVRGDIKDAEDLLKHFLMLTGGDSDDANLVRMPLEFLNNRCHFDSIRACPKHTGNRNTLHNATPKTGHAACCVRAMA